MNFLKCCTPKQVVLKYVFFMQIELMNNYVLMLLFSPLFDSNSQVLKKYLVIFPELDFLRRMINSLQYISFFQFTDGIMYVECGIILYNKVGGLFIIPSAVS